MGLGLGFRVVEFVGVGFGLYISGFFGFRG